MRIYFLRHGRAAARADWRDDDDERPLTEEGEAAMRREAAALAALGLKPEVIVTSPLARARRTAELVAEALQAEDRVVEDARLAHGFDARSLADIVTEQAPKRALMVVGHEPDFSATIADLIGGGHVICKKGGLARVDVDASDGHLRNGALVWLLAPSQLAGE
jgi:phosphohistidine phosphatase